MLFKNRFLEGIKTGKIVLAFRKWRRPTVKQGGTLLTPVGMLRIISVDVIDYPSISNSEISQAGYVDRAELDKALLTSDAGDIYRIRFRVEQQDPRIRLREERHISDEEMVELRARLGRLDGRGRHSKWTLKILEAVKREPGKPARYYAQKLGYEKEWFKQSIRKLKNMGLTISLTDGYTISPRGETLLEKLNA